MLTAQTNRAEVHSGGINSKVDTLTSRTATLRNGALHGTVNLGKENAYMSLTSLESHYHHLKGNETAKKNEKEKQDVHAQTSYQMKNWF